MKDAELDRYVALARRVHALLSEPEPESLDAPPEVPRLIAVGVFRLGLNASAMPGAQATSMRELQDLRAQLDEPGQD
jgi:hypothetical protein